MQKLFARVGLPVAFGATVLPAHAALDVTAVTTAISDASTAGLAVASAVLIMLIGFKAYKWIRSAT